MLSILACAGLYVLSWQDVNDSLNTQASTYADFVLTTRLWNAEHQTVYVLKTPQSTSNLYLKDIGIEPDARDDRRRRTHHAQPRGDDPRDLRTDRPLSGGAFPLGFAQAREPQQRSR